MAFILSVVVGIPLGIFAALGHNRGPDYVSTSISIIGIATPSFVLAILLIVFFAVQLGWFPTGGWKGPQYWVLPTIALAGFPIAVIARYTRASMLEVTRKDYIRTAQSKGVARPGGRVAAHDPQRADPGRHDPRADAGIPRHRLVHHRDGSSGSRASGSYYITSISTRDYGLLMAMTMLYAFAVAFLNVVVDVLYAYIDPRIRYS